MDNKAIMCVLTSMVIIVSITHTYLWLTCVFFNFLLKVH